MQKNKKILEVCEAYGGGVKRHIDYLNTYLNGRKVELTFIVSSKRGAGIPDGYLVDDRMSEALKKPWLCLGFLKNVHKVIKSGNIDIIHAHSTIAGLLMVLYKIVYHSNVPMVFTPHAYFSEVPRGKVKDKILICIEKSMNSFFKKVVHVSSEEERYALKAGLVKNKNSLVVNNGAPKNYTPIVRNDIKGNVFINVARCSFQKNPELFISIAQLILKKEENCTFVWVGDGPLLAECREKVQGLNLKSKISFVGYSSDPYEYLAKADVFLSTSKYEGLPFSVLEAMSLKMPLLLTDIVGHRELIKDNGELLSSDDQKNSLALIQKVRNVLDNKDEFSKNSFSLFTDKYSVGQMVQKINGIYAKL